tara:strand:- start:801 stop:983 length:183 start_codon:yes stop_codon:yes gene_type:complete
MAKRKAKYVISLQSTQGTNPKVSFEVTGHKAERILDLLESDIAKDRKKRETTSITLDHFF